MNKTGGVEVGEGPQESSIKGDGIETIEAVEAVKAAHLGEAAIGVPDESGGLSKASEISGGDQVLVVEDVSGIVGGNDGIDVLHDGSGGHGPDHGGCGGNGMDEGRGGANSLHNGGGNGGIDGNGWRSGLSIVGDHGVESVHGIGSVSDPADSAVGVGHGVRSGHGIAISGLFAGLGVSSLGIGHGVSELVGGVNVMLDKGVKGGWNGSHGLGLEAAEGHSPQNHVLRGC